MTLTIPSYKKPVEEVARTLAEADGVFGISLAFTEEQDNDTATIREMRRLDTRRAMNAGRLALTRLRQLGFINDIGLAAIHAEEDSNGQPRSSVVPGKDEAIRAEEAGK